jgi:hypothetical protein
MPDRRLGKTHWQDKQALQLPRQVQLIGHDQELSSHGANAETCPAHAGASGPEPGGRTLRTVVPGVHRALFYCVTGDEPSPEVLTRLLQSHREFIQMALRANLEHSISGGSTGPISIVPGCSCERSRPDFAGPIRERFVRMRTTCWRVFRKSVRCFVQKPRNHRTQWALN